MSAVLLVLTVLLCVVGLACMAMTNRDTRSHFDVIGLCILNGAGIVAACYAAITSL